MSSSLLFELIKGRTFGEERVKAEILCREKSNVSLAKKKKDT